MKDFDITSILDEAQKIISKKGFKDKQFLKYYENCMSENIHIIFCGNEPYLCDNINFVRIAKSITDLNLICDNNSVKELERLYKKEWYGVKDSEKCFKPGGFV